MKFVRILFSSLMSMFVFADSVDHILLNRIVITPSEAESFSITNPTAETINLSDYYICDDQDYYQMQTDADLSPSATMSGFTARFPDINIQPNDTLIIVLNENYNSFYNSLIPDFTLFDNSEGLLSMIETEVNSFGLSTNKLDDENESLILFKWDGNPNNNIEDIDYFIWGGNQGAVNKTGINNYLDDTSAENQLFFETTPTDYYAFSRINGLDELDEISLDGNGITGHDETSENFRQSWEIISLVTMGCTNPSAPNYNPDASVDDESCALTFYNVINNCVTDDVECSGQYDLQNNSDCPLVGESLTLIGTVVDFYDITPSNGPYSFKIEDDNGYRVSFVVWPESSSFQDGFDIMLTDLKKITEIDKYKIQITGVLDVYCRGGITLDISNDWQVVVEYESDIIILEEIHGDGTYYESSGVCFNDNGLFNDNFEIKEDCLENDNYEWILTDKAKIIPAPYVIIPSLGEKLDFSYVSPLQARTIVRIFDLSGRFITTLVDRYDEQAMIILNDTESSSWNGRDEVGQLVAPGTYLMHLEAMNFATGETTTDVAPVVVGVKQ
jgi:hypothetical protein